MRYFTFGIFLWALLLAAGCNRQPYMTAQRFENGFVIVLTGIEGRGRLNEQICRGLDAGGVDWAIKLEDWTVPLGPLYNLRAELSNRTTAESIARRIELYHWDYPNRPVVLVGHSGGGALAAWVVESLYPGHDVDGVIMLAPSLSPGYMLDWVLGRSRRGVISFHSSGDWMMLGVGTTISGTMDGYHSSSAGRGGFDVPSDSARAELYEKLFQVAWDKTMAESGHTGGHLSSGAAGFVSEYVAPLIAAEHWNQDILGRILGRGDTETSTSVPATQPSHSQTSAETQPQTSPGTQPVPVTTRSVRE